MCKGAGLCVREDMAGFHRREPARMRPTLAFPQSPRSLPRERERGGRKARIVGVRTGRGDQAGQASAALPTAFGEDPQVQPFVLERAELQDC